MSAKTYRGKKVGTRRRRCGRSAFWVSHFGTRQAPWALSPLIAGDPQTKIVILPSSQGRDQTDSKIVILLALSGEGSQRSESKNPSCSLLLRLLSSRILIANPRLKFQLTGCRTNHIKFSNRERIAFFSLDSSVGTAMSLFLNASSSNLRYRD
jgi:hypothetical protein